MKYPAYSQQPPAGWMESRLKFLVELRNEKIDAQTSEYDYVGLEHIESWTGRRLSDPDAKAEGVASVFMPGDVLFGKLRPYLAKVHLAAASGMCSTEALVLVSGSTLNPRFLKYQLISQRFIDGASGAAYGSKMPRANWEDIGNQSILVPLLQEQEHIANFLDWKTGQIDALIAKKQALVVSLSEQRLSLITEHITGARKTGVRRGSAKAAWLAGMPSHWQAIPLGFLVDVSGGMTPNMAVSEYWGGDVPWVTPKDMKRPRIGDSIDHVTDRALAETGLSLMAPGHVLVVVRGMILAHSFPVAITTAPVTINQDMKALKCGEHLDHEYLFWCLTGFGSLLCSLAQDSAHGTRKMETDTIKKFVMPVPPMDEQRRISKAIRDSVGRLDRMLEATDRTVVRLTEYRAGLITAAVTGQIDVRGVAVPAAG